MRVEGLHSLHHPGTADAADTVEEDSSFLVVFMSGTC